MVKIALDKIRISSFNVRSEEYFGDDEDKSFVENVGKHGVLLPIIVTPKGDMFDVYSGRRRFLAAKELGMTEIDCIVKEVYDEGAQDISLIENIHRKNLDPVTIGRALKRRMDSTGISASKLGNILGISRQAVSQYLRMVDLSPDMQNEVQSGKVTFTEALKVVRMNLPIEKEIDLAREAREVGSDSFKKTLDRFTAEQEKRGAPPGLLIVRISWGKKSKEYNSLKRFAKADDISISDYCQKILTEHIQSRKG